jgi:hypothetical protein
MTISPEPHIAGRANFVMTLSGGSPLIMPGPPVPASAADLKFLHPVRQSLPGTSNRKAALET